MELQQSTIIWLTATICSTYAAYMPEDNKPYQTWLINPAEQYATTIKDITQAAQQSGGHLYEYLENMGSGVINNAAYWVIANTFTEYEDEPITIISNR